MRLINADEIMEFPYNETSGTDEQIDTWIREVFDASYDCGGIYVSDKYEDELKELCWKVINGMLSVVETQPTVEVFTRSEQWQICNIAQHYFCMGVNEIAEEDETWKSIFEKLGIIENEEIRKIKEFSDIDVPK